MLPTLSAPMSLGSASLRRDDGRPVTRTMQSAHIVLLPMLSSISDASKSCTESPVLRSKHGWPVAADSARSYFEAVFRSAAAHASATSRLGSWLPGTVAQPVLVTKSRWS